MNTNIICKACNHTITPPVKICPNCGTDISQKNPTSTESYALTAPLEIPEIPPYYLGDFDSPDIIFYRQIMCIYEAVDAANKSIAEQRSLFFNYYNQKVNLAKEKQAAIEDVQKNIDELTRELHSVRDVFSKIKPKHNANLQNHPTQPARYHSLMEINQVVSNTFYYGTIAGIVSPKSKNECIRIGKEAEAFIIESIQYHENQKKQIDAQFNKKIAEIQRLMDVCSRKIVDISDDIIELLSHEDTLKADVALRSYYSTVFDVAGKDAEPYSEKNYKRNSILLGKKTISLPDADMNLCTNLGNISNSFLSVNPQANTITFTLPEIDFIKDSNCIYYFRQQEPEYNRSEADIVDMVRSYIFQLLQQSSPNEYDFVFCDPISNGQNLGPILSLIHENAHSIAFKVHCEKQEISSALQQLSNKTKEINHRLKSHKTIYEHNKKETEQIPSTVFIAFDFCDDYYEKEKLMPILENAASAGITILLIETTNHTNETKRSRETLSAFEHALFCGNIIEHGYITYIQTSRNLDSWIENYSNQRKRQTTISSDYAEHNSKLPEYFSRKADCGLSVPFAISPKGDIVDFRLAISHCHHALITGQIGAGKSVLLNTLVTSIIRCYHPDDVELWLVDYKAVEFNEYVSVTPPHIKLIGLDNSWEFTKSFLDKLLQVLDERKKRILDAGLKTIGSYKKTFGINSMPYTILLVDEAHVLSNYLNAHPEYKTKFDNLLREYRVFGFHAILSDQAFANSLNGLTAEGKNQIGVRLAMSNSREEIKGVLDIDSDIAGSDSFKRDASSLSNGEAIYRWTEDTDSGAVLHLDKVKCLYSDKFISEVCTKASTLANELGCKPKERWIIVSKDQASIFHVENPFNNITPMDNGARSFNVYLGAPSSLEPYHQIYAKRRKDANFLVVSDSDVISNSIAFFTAASMRKALNAKIYVFAFPGVLNNSIRRMLSYCFSQNLFIAENMEAYNIALDRIKSSPEACLILWYGIDDILDDMGMLDSYPSKPQAQTTSFGSSDNPFASLMGKIDEPQQTSAQASFETVDVTTQKIFYDRSEEIYELLSKGSGLLKFSMLMLSSLKEIAKKRSIKLDFFEHRIVQNQSAARDVFEASCPIEIDNKFRDSTAIYYDCSEFSIVRPYTIDDKTLDYFKED